MSDNPISPVSAGPVYAGGRALPGNGAELPAIATAALQATGRSATSKEGEAGRPASKPESQPAPKAILNMEDVCLKFKVDAKSNDVTLLIVNRATREVVRTIPPDEMKRLTPGDLLELFA